ncbi:MAG: hypothetical protein FWE31_05870, partial [Firmicutes bacterium]|nr:hypothetical protein [Bacillota bacterium]
GSTFALTTTGELWGWGHNSNGQIGDGTTETRTSPTRIGTRNDWITVSAGQHHTLGMTADGVLWAWGTGSAKGIGPSSGNTLIPTRVDLTIR